MLGAAEELIKLGILDPGSTPLAGASAGALLAASIRAGLPSDDVMRSCLELNQEVARNGLKGRLRRVLKEQLHKDLPSDAARRCSTGDVHIALTRVFPSARPVFINAFTCRRDLTKALLASCHLPRISDAWLFASFRGARYLDGGLTNFLPTPPGAAASVRICCLPGAALAQLPAFMRPPAAGEVSIAPGLQSEWGWGLGETMQMALTPQTPHFLQQLRLRGQRDAAAWAAGAGFPAALEGADARAGAAAPAAVAVAAAAVGVGPAVAALDGSVASAAVAGMMEAAEAAGQAGALGQAGGAGAGGRQAGP